MENKLEIGIEYKGFLIFNGFNKYYINKDLVTFKYEKIGSCLYDATRDTNRGMVKLNLYDGNYEVQDAIDAMFYFKRVHPPIPYGSQLLDIWFKDLGRDATSYVRTFRNDFDLNSFRPDFNDFVFFMESYKSRDKEVSELIPALKVKELYFTSYTTKLINASKDLCSIGQMLNEDILQKIKRNKIWKFQK